MNHVPSEAPHNQEFSHWFAELRPELVRYCRSLCGNVWEADDLVQDTFIKVMNRCRAEPSLKPNKPYVLRAARNLWIDRCRQKARNADVSLQEIEAIAEPAPFETRLILEDLMHKLLPKPFVILLLCDVFQLTAKDAASCINATEGSVQVALSRARSRLRLLASRESPEHCATTTRPQPNETLALTQLLEAVTNGFRRHDPRLIYDAYMRLFESGSRIAAIRAQAGRLYFTFRDPDGNLLMVSG